MSTVNSDEAKDLSVENKLLLNSLFSAQNVTKGDDDDVTIGGWRQHDNEVKEFLKMELERVLRQGQPHVIAKKAAARARDVSAILKSYKNTSNIYQPQPKRHKGPNVPSSKLQKSDEKICQVCYRYITGPLCCRQPCHICGMSPTMGSIETCSVCDNAYCSDCKEVHKSIGSGICDTCIVNECSTCRNKPSDAIRCDVCIACVRDIKRRLKETSTAQSSSAFMVTHDDGYKKVITSDYYKHVNEEEFL